MAITIQKCRDKPGKKTTGKYKQDKNVHYRRFWWYDTGNHVVYPGVRVMVFNATFYNSVISWGSANSALLVEETGVPGENHRPAANQTLFLIHSALIVYRCRLHRRARDRIHLPVWPVHISPIFWDRFAHTARCNRYNFFFSVCQWLTAFQCIFSSNSCFLWPPRYNALSVTHTAHARYTGPALSQLDQLLRWSYLHLYLLLAVQLHKTTHCRFNREQHCARTSIWPTATLFVCVKCRTVISRWWI